MAQPSAVENVSWLRKFYVKLQTNRWANKKSMQLLYLVLQAQYAQKLRLYSILSKFHVRALFPRLNVSE